MPEISEEIAFRRWIQRFIDHSKNNLPAGALQIVALYTDMKDSELADMEKREQRVLAYASTLNPKMLHKGFHIIWATRLGRLADAVPDTHGLLIHKVWDRLPTVIQKQISPNYTSWPDFCAAICSIQAGVACTPEDLPIPWFKQPNAGNLQYDLPSNTRLAVKLNNYMPPTWRGIEPDRRLTVNVSPVPDKAWEDPISVPASITTVFPSPTSLHHDVHSDVFSPIAPTSLASPSSSRVKASKSATIKTSKAKPKPKSSIPNSLLTAFGFTADSSSNGAPSFNEPSVAGVSSHLDTLGVKKHQRKPEDCTERDIDHSLYLFPCYLFPTLANGGNVADCGLELTDIEHDPRSLILNLRSCFLEIEPLLHTSPQIFTNEDWERVAGVPAADRSSRKEDKDQSRGFKVVIALQMRTHTLAFLSMDNLCYVYWFSRADIALARSARVPDVVLNYWQWCRYVVKWLKEQDENPKWDMNSFAYVLSMPGNHPMRGVGRYSADEIAWRSGVPLWTLWRDVRLNPKLLCAVLETFFLFTLERYTAVDEFFSESKRLNKRCGIDNEDTDNSFLLITTKDSVLRYERMLSIHKQAWCTMSERKKRLVLRYNRLSIRSHTSSCDVMRHAPWTFDLADLVPAVLLFGHMGPAIVDNWADLFAKEATLATTSEMRERYRSKLPPNLTEFQQLSFKPVVDLTTDEIQLLTAAHGVSNPVVHYLKSRFPFQPSSQSLSTPLIPIQPIQPLPSTSASGDSMTTIEYADAPMTFEVEDNVPMAFNDVFMGDLPLLTDGESSESEGDSESDSDSDVDEHVEHIVEGSYQETVFVDPTVEEEEGSDDDGEGIWEDRPLTLIRDSFTRRKLPTRLCKCGITPSFCSWTVLKPPQITTTPNAAYRPPKAVVFMQLVDSIRLQRTLQAIKGFTKLYTVGPLDFCGHAKAIRRGQGWIISLCRWDPTLPDKDQLFMKANWDAIGAWPKGISKSSHKLVKKAIALRSKVRKLLRESWTLTRNITQGDVDGEVAKQRRKRREADRQKALQAAQKAAKKALLKGKGKKVENIGMAQTTVVKAVRTPSDRLLAKNVPSASSLLGIVRRGSRTDS